MSAINPSSNLINLFLIKRENGVYSEVSAVDASLQVATSGTVNFGHDSALGGQSLIGFNWAKDSFGSNILGGSKNRVQGALSTIAGGFENLVSGGFYTAIGGGTYNKNYGAQSYIGGGASNCIVSNLAFIGGGNGNRAQGSLSSILGGEENETLSYNANAVGGRYNVAGASGGGYQNDLGHAWYATAVGGFRNRAASFGSFTFGGQWNLNSGCWSIIEGGAQHAICNHPTLGFIGSTGWRANSCNHAIIGGYLHRIVSYTGQDGELSMAATILGGQFNRIEGYTTNTTIIGGRSNSLYGNDSSIIGGHNNFISTRSEHVGMLFGGSNTLEACTGLIYSAILGGTNAQIRGSSYAWMVNSVNSRICSGSACSSIFGGQSVIIDNLHSGSTVLGDGSIRQKISSGPNTLTLDFSSGVWFKSNINPESISDSLIRASGIFV